MSRTGMILCGGRSQRMGQDKALLPLGPRTMLETLLDRLTQCVDHVMVVAGPAQTLPALPPTVQIVRDEVPGQGPLVALARGMNHLAPESDRILLCGVDAPLLQPRLGRWLMDQLDEAPSGLSFGACVLWNELRWHPLPAAYHTRLLPTLQDLLARDEQSLARLLESVQVRVCSPDDIEARDPQRLSYLSANTPEEYEQLKQAWAASAA